jgi:hypothetical protein
LVSCLLYAYTVIYSKYLRERLNIRKMGMTRKTTLAYEDVIEQKPLAEERGGPDSEDGGKSSTGADDDKTTGLATVPAQFRTARPRREKLN